MSTPALPLRPIAVAPSVAPATVRRAALLAGCIVSVALAAWVGDPAHWLRADAELARLLRGMAVIKGGIVAATLAVLWWRFGRPLPARTTGVYLAGAWLAAGASTLVWQLSFIPLAAAAFHVAELSLLVTAWRDGLRH